MLCRLSNFTTILGLSLCLNFTYLPSALSQGSESDEKRQDETVIVTGTYLSVDQDTIASPVDVIDRRSIEASGAATVNDLLKNLESNVGAEFNADIFTQNTSGGTSQVNLRGLGLSSTLTLVNGRRMTLSGAYANDGSTFVDINTVPLIAVERVDVVKDGSSALYGSDAVAGVVDFITRRDFEGLELSSGYQTTTNDRQTDKDISLLWGWHGEKIKTMLALSYFDRSPLAADKREYTKGTGISVLGNPGAFVPMGAIDPSSPYAALDGLAPGMPIRDAGCEAGGGVIPDGSDAYFGTCSTDYIKFFNLISEEERKQALFTVDLDVDENWSMFGEMTYAKMEQKQRATPSFPNLTFPIIPATNIGNLPGNGGFGTPVVFLGRALDESAPASMNDRESETFRVLAVVNNKINERWKWESAYNYSFNNYYFGGPDILIDRFNAALNGQGGPDNDEYFNPFSSAIFTPELANSQSVIDDFTSLSEREIKTSLHTWDAVLIGSLFDMEAGPVESAFGVQYRRESNRQTLDANSNAQNFVFVVGSSNSSDDRDVYSMFTEFMFPVTADVNVQLAGRFEEYGGHVGNSFDPKIGVRWNITPELSLRTSASTAFRAPSLHQTSSNTIALQEIENAFIPIVTDGSSDLKPETAKIFNLGFVYNPLSEVRASIDYWRYDYNDIIIKENAEGIYENDPNDPRIVRDPTINQITRINLNYINASSVITDGVDLSVEYRTVTDYGQFYVTNSTSYVNRYDLKLDDGGETIRAVGSRNFLNMARSLPHWRSSIMLGWSNGGHEVSTTVRYTGAYKDDENNDDRIDDHLTQDFQYNYFVPVVMNVEPQLTLGVINMFDQDPPAVNTNYGFDSKLHDPRGRLVYGRITLRY